jgi:uncharacterized protein involved in exopolysaccharide biosynthesis
MGPRIASARPVERPAGSLADVDTALILAWLRRGLWLILGVATLGAVAGLLFGTLVPARYTATVDLIIDPGHLQVVSDDILPQAQQSDAQLLAVESKLRVLTAGTTLAAVVAKLHLDQDPEFTSDAGLPLGSAAVPASPSVIALRNLDKRVSARREERSYVVTLAVWTADPAKSVKIADAVVASFKDELAKSNADAAGQAAAALDERLASLRAAASAAEDKVEAFKREHHLVESGGQLTSTLSITQLNTQVVEATARFNEAQAHYQQLVSGDNADDADANALDSTTMSALRAQYAQLKQQVDSLAASLGPQHPTLRAAKAQLAGAQAQIQAETARMIQAAKQQMDQSRAALDALKAEVTKASANVFEDNEAQVQLNQLERDAAAQATVYQTFLARARNVAEQQQIDTTNIRVISPPILPSSRSFPPRTILLVGAGGLLGLALGAGLAVAFGFWRRIRPAQRTATHG